MKKFFGGLFSLLAYLLLVAALTLPTMGLMHWLNESGSMDSVAKIFENEWVLLGVCAAMSAFVVLLGTLINNKLGGASYFFSILFGLGAYGALLYVVMWGPAKESTTALLPMIKQITLGNSQLYYIGIGIAAFALILSAIGRRMHRIATGKARRKKLAKQLQVDEAYLPTSRDTDLAVASSRTPKIERYVRDPWGNLIREEDYNERVNQSRTRKL